MHLFRTLTLLATVALVPGAGAQSLDVPEDLRMITSAEEARTLLVSYRADSPVWSETYFEDGTLKGNNHDGKWSGKWSVDEVGGMAVVSYDYRGRAHDTSSIVGVATVDGQLTMYYFHPDTKLSKGSGAYAKLVPLN